MRSRAPLLIVLAGIAGLAYLWLGTSLFGQAKVLLSFGIAALVAGLVLLWVAFGSGWPARRRIGAVGLCLFALAAFAALFRVRGVTGDFVPVFDARWRPKERVAAVPPSSSIAPTPAVVEPSPRPGSGGSSPPPPPTTLNDYPQFLGPNRDGTLTGVRLETDWRKHPPKLVWRQPIGLGWSAFAVANGIAVTQEQRGPDELVTAYDLRTGRLRWSHADHARFDSVMAGDGPRAAPTIDAGRAFAIGSTGILNALDLETGRKLWGKDIVQENGARVPGFGKVSSPLVVGGHVIVSAGGAGRSLVAYDAANGSLVWSAGSDASGYSSPVQMTLLGTEQIVIFNAASVVAHDPASGAVLWEQAWPREQPNVAQPLKISDDEILVSSGYGIGSKLLHIAAAADGTLRAQVVWETTRFKSKFVNMVLVDGFVYGFDDGVFACLDPATGERKWKAGRYGHGQMILVDRTVLVSTEEGELVLVNPSPEGLQEMARFQALDGKTWNPPALAAPYLLVRNDKEAACYELALQR